MRKHSKIVPQSVIRLEYESPSLGSNETKNPPQAKPIKKVLDQPPPNSALTQVIRVRRKDSVASHAQHLTNKQLWSFDMMKHSKLCYDIKGGIRERKFIPVACCQPVAGDALTVRYAPELID